MDMHVTEPDDLKEFSARARLPGEGPPGVAAAGQPAAAPRRRRRALLLGSVAVVAVAGAGFAFLVSPYNALYPVPVLASQVRAQVDRVAEAVGFAPVPIVAPSASLADVERPEASGPVIRPRHVTVPRDRQISEVLALLDAGRPGVAAASPGTAGTAAAEPGVTGPSTRQPAPPASVRRSPPVARAPSWAAAAVLEPGAVGAPDAASQAVPLQAVVADGPGGSAPEPVRPAAEPSPAPPSPAAPVPSGAEPSVGIVATATPTGAAQATPALAAASPQPSTAPEPGAGLAASAPPAAPVSASAGPSAAGQGAIPQAVVPPSREPGALAVPAAATAPPPPPPEPAAPAFAARPEPALPSVAPSPPPAARRDPVATALALRAAPLAPAEQVQVIDLVTQIATLVAEQRRQSAQATADVARIAGEMRAQLDDYARRLALAEARAALGAARDAGLPTEPTAPTTSVQARGADASRGVQPVALVRTATVIPRREVVPAPEAGLTRYRVQAASPGLAMLAEIDRGGGDGAQLQVSVGDTLPGWGRVRSIAQRGTAWVLTTERGEIR